MYTFLDFYNLRTVLTNKMFFWIPINSRSREVVFLKHETFIYLPVLGKFFLIFGSQVESKIEGKIKNSETFRKNTQD